MTEQGIFQILFLVFLFLLGSAIGSFLACQVRRLRLQETEVRKAQSSKGDSNKIDPVLKVSQNGFASVKPDLGLGRRSVCLKCHYQLKWYDNIPIFSWLFLKGKCRRCGEKIGILEIAAEVLMGLAFLAYGASVLFSPEGVIFRNFSGLSLAGPGVLVLIRFILMLFLISGLGFLALYDGAYGELPVRPLTFSIICAIIIAIVDQTSFFLVSSGVEMTGADMILNRARQAQFVFGVNFATFPLSLVNLAGAVGILGGVYLLLYVVSKGKWVGDGDWLLGLSLGLALGNAWLALITLFVANLLALILNLPALNFKNHGPSRKIYFGPFLVAAFVIVLTFSESLKSMIS